MERDYPAESNSYERLDTDLSQRDPADVRDDEDDTDVNRRDTISAVIGSVTPGNRPPAAAETAVYGDTDMNPNRDDQADAHRAGPDDVV